MQVHLLQDLAVIFAVSVLVVLVFHRFRLPALPGFIVAGLLLGPNALGLVADVHAVEALAEVGVILLLFTIGIEFSLARLREMARQVVGVGVLQVGLTAAAATLLGLVLVSRWQVAVFLGLLVALSSTAIVLKLLTDRGEIDAPHGRLATAILIFQDLCVVPIMLLVPFLAGTAKGGAVGMAVALGKAALIVVGVIVAARLLVPRLLREILKTRSRELFLISIILLVTLTALGTAAAGASLALGAFLAGLVLSESDYGHQALAELLPFRDVFISLFFVAVGMLVDLAFLRNHPWVTASGIALVLGGKTVFAGAAPMLMGSAGRVALLAGLAVSQIGEFSFVLAREGQTTGLLSAPLYQTFLAVAVCTMLLTPFLIQGGPVIVQGLERVLPLRRLLPESRTPLPEVGGAHDQLRDHVIIAGYGLNGRNLAAALRSVGVAYYIVELNAQTVRQARAQGEPAFYGDATREEILHALGVDRARLFVVAISDPAATRRMVRVARGVNQDLFIIARTRYVVEIPELTRLGADVVIPEEFETSVEIFARVLSHYRVPRETVDQLTDQIRAAHYAALRTPTGVTAAAVLPGLPRMLIERVRLAPGAFAVGRSLASLALRTRTGALVVSLKRDGQDHPTPDPDLVLETEDELVIVAQPPQIDAARRLVLDG